jgi:hypothetical protein
VRTYEVVLRFRTNADPRADITNEQIQGRLVPYFFPRSVHGSVTVLGSTVTRIDDEREADRGNQT